MRIHTELAPISVSGLVEDFAEDKQSVLDIHNELRMLIQTATIGNDLFCNGIVKRNFYFSNRIMFIKKTASYNKLEALNWLLPILIISLVFILDPRYFSSAPLRSDDWNQIVAPQIFNTFKIIDFYNRRPLLNSLFALITPVFGLKIYWYYVVNWLILFMTGVAFYQIVKKAFPEHAWLALPASLIFLIYPVNYARTWLSVAINSFSLLFALVAILLMILFSRSGKWIYLFLGNLLFLLSLGIYEASFGNVMLTALLLIAFTHEIKLKRRAWLITFLLTGLGFFVWRSFVQPDLIGVEDFYLSNVDLSLPIIFTRYLQGGFIFLYNWFGLIFSICKERKYIVFIIAAISLVITFFAFFPKIIKTAKKDREFSYDDRLKQIKSLVSVAFVGVLFWASGYIPVISVYQPTFYGDSSRVNYSAIPGAALALAAGLASLMTLIIRKRKSFNHILMVALAVFLLSGVLLQIHSQNFRFQTWETNKALWHGVFNTVPNIANETIVVIVIPGFTQLQPFEIVPFHGDWEAQSALQVLYNNPTLFAEYYYRDLLGHPDNWSPTDNDLSRYIFLFFDPDAKTVHLVDDPSAALGIPFEFENYNPKHKIENPNPQSEIFRFLVGSKSE